MGTDGSEQGRFATVSNAYPDKRRSSWISERQVQKVFILADQNRLLLARVFPYLAIVRSGHAKINNVIGIVSRVPEKHRESWWKLVVNEESHELTRTT
ncbi:MAG: hypothetical protein WD768_21910 [Phycisphaeraceae bacterium]